MTHQVILNKPEDDEEIDPSEIEEHNNLLTFFLYHYCRILVNELDKKVREAAQTTMGNFIALNQKHPIQWRLSPHLNKIIPIMLISMHDTSLEVA